jgi:hypothetical protein
MQRFTTQEDKGMQDLQSVDLQFGIKCLKIIKVI